MINRKRVWLEQLLHARGLTHQQAADMSHIDRSYFTQIVNGTRRPSPEVAKRIAEAFGFAAAWYRLLEREDDV